MQTRAASTCYMEHVLNIQPDEDEIRAFHGFDLAFLEPNASWPPLLLNYIHRWMHHHNLYNVCPSKAVTFSKLIDSLMLRTALPSTELVREALTLRCRSLIADSALKWKDERLLVQNGTGFSKTRQLKTIWAAHETSFEQKEVEILRIIDGGGGKKREGNSPTAKGGATKKLRINNHHTHEGSDRAEATLLKPGNDTGSDSNSSEYIIVDVKAALPEPSHSGCGSPHLGNQEVQSNSMVKSDSSPHPGSQEIHSKSMVGSDGPNAPAIHAHRSSPSHQLPLNEDSCEKFHGYPAQVHTQQTETIHQQASAALPNATTPSNVTVPTSLPPKVAIAKMDDGIPPNQAYMSSPPLIVDTTAPSIPVSRDLEHPAQSTAVTEVQVQGPFPSPRYHGVSNQVRKVTTLEPFARSSGTLGAIAQPLQSNPQNTKHAMPRTTWLDRSGTQTQTGAKDFIAPGQSKSNPTYAYQVAGIVARRGHLTTTSRMFESLGKILVPMRNQSKVFNLHVNELMTQSANQFFGQFSELIELGACVSMLKFELLDLIPRQGQPNWSMCVSRNNQVNFEDLKKSLFNLFAETVSERSDLETFRILVTAPDLFAPSNNNGLRRVSRTVSQTQIQGAIPTSVNAKKNTRQPIPPPSSIPDRRNFQVPVVAQPPRTIQGSPPHLFPQIVVRIQVDRSGHMSKPYPKEILTTNNAEFFTWFAKETGCNNRLGPPELMFSFKDAFPLKNNLITRGNTEHFEYMREDITPMCEKAAIYMPGLSEFAILITVPGWGTETNEEE